MTAVVRIQTTGGIFGGTKPTTFEAKPAPAAVMTKAKPESLAEVIKRVSGEVADNVAPAIAKRFKARRAASFAAQPATAKPTHLDAVDEYMQHHGHYAAQDISLFDRVCDWFANSPDASEATEEILAAVRRQSEQLAATWREGKVQDPFA